MQITLCCSLHVFDFSLPLFSQMAKCDGCKRQGKLSESMKWQGEIKHFCNLLCILMFCNQQNASDPPPPNNTGKTGCEWYYLLVCVTVIGVFIQKLNSLKFLRDILYWGTYLLLLNRLSFRYLAFFKFAFKLPQILNEIAHKENLCFDFQDEV